MTKIDVVEACGGMLILHLIALDISKSREAKRVKSRRIRIEFGVLVNDMAHDHAGSAVRDCVTGGCFQASRVGDDTRYIY